MIVHSLFDVLASLTAMALTMAVYHWRLRDAALKIENAGVGYAISLVAGAVIGGYGAGTVNLWVTGVPEFGRSIVGALAGAIAAVELFKWKCGLQGSTGLIFVPAFATSVAVGRWGCFLSGLQDHTHGTVTALPWGYDFGDGLLRHPVQLYESFAMAAFLIVALLLIATRNRWFIANGFYLLVLFYGVQRFLWEFLKPYGALLGPFNLFHFICLSLVIYSALMMGKSHERAGS